MIPEHTIEEVLERVDLVSLVSRHVDLKKAGRSFKGRCPFHEEKSASFHVTPELKRFKCFGCQAGGDAIAFVQRYLGKSFVDAVRDLAREAGVDLASAEDPGAQERQRLREATDVAAEHFRTMLWHPEKGTLARQALTSRGVGEEAARRFGLGWAPDAWSLLGEVLLARGILEFGIQAGLVSRRSRGEGTYDTFRGRLIIPIRNPDGRTIAFGGRLLVGDQGPKYLNSRESRLYNKSETLYGLDLAREEIRRRKAAVLVEGYFDCIGLHQAGVHNAVALCSTTLTPGHLASLARAEARELVLLLDGDDAGRQAIERLAGPLLSAGSTARVALLPDGEDPDTFARAQGEPGVRELLSRAQPLSQHLFDTVLPEGTEAPFERKMQALERLRPVAAVLPVGLVRSAFFAALSRATGLPAAELEAGLRGRGPGGAAPAVLKSVPKPVSKPAGGAVAGAAARAPERPADPLEAAFVATALRVPAVLTREGFRMGDELLHPGLRTVVARLQAGRPPEEALEEVSEGVRTALDAARASLPSEGEDLQSSFAWLSRKLKLRRVDEQLTHIARVTGQVQSAHELNDETKRLQEERVELLSLKRRILGTFVKPGHAR